MNILITGSNGFLGSVLVSRLSTHKLSLLDRGPSKHDIEHKFLQSEINAKNDYSSVLRDCDVVIHCAARVHVMDDRVASPIDAYREVNTFGTLNIAKQAVEAGVSRFIFISSIKVNGETTVEGHPFTEIDEHRFEDDYGQSKSEAELLLQDLARETGIEVVVIRPTLVYGPGVKANFASLMTLVNKGIPLPFKCISSNRRSLVSIDNLTDLIATCIDHPRAANQTFLVSDDNDISTSDMVTQLAEALGKPQWQLPVPKLCYRLIAKMLGKQKVIDRLLNSLQVDISHTKETLNWSPPQTLQEGFKQTAEAYLRSQKYSGKA